MCVFYDSIPNLKDEQSPTMVVCGRSLLPYCHFHLEDSDYISGNRRNPELRGPHGALPRAPLDPNTRVIEFRSVGIGSSILRWVVSLITQAKNMFTTFE
jgi:hydrocephalus-inducing protein